MRPTRLTIALCAGWLAWAVAAALLPSLAPSFRLAGIALAALVLADGWLLWRRSLPEVTRRLPPTMALGEGYEVELCLRSEDGGHYTLFDDPPGQAQASGMPWRLGLEAGRSATVRYRFRPLARGELRFGRPVLGRRGPLGLWEQRCRVGAAGSTRVFPNFRHLAQYVSPGESLFFRGVQLQRRRGEGMEFHQLRPYRQGDVPNHIDWKSVSRRQQLITREYRAEQNQSLVLAIDCGRRMRAHDGELTLLDQALNAVLLLSHVALGQGDAVGVLAFGGARRRWLPPVRGAAGLRHVLDTVYDIESSTDPGDLEEAAGRLLVEQRRRALVVVLSNLGDEDVQALQPSFRLLRRKHLVVLASLRDPELTGPLERDPDTPQEALDALSALTYLGERRAARRRLVGAGIDVLESLPHELPVKLVDHYLRIKRAGRL